MTAAAPEAEFSLRALINDAIEGGIADPTEIAAKVLAQIPHALVRDALEETLRHYVVQVASNLRAQHAPVGPGKAQLVRDWYKSWLRQPMHCGDQWKALGECTAIDLKAAVDERREHAQRTNAIADQLQRVADELRARKLIYVNQLPEDVAARLTGRPS